MRCVVDDHVKSAWCEVATDSREQLRVGLIAGRDAYAGELLKSFGCNEVNTDDPRLGKGVSPHLEGVALPDAHLDERELAVTQVSERSLVDREVWQGLDDKSCSLPGGKVSQPCGWFGLIPCLPRGGGVGGRRHSDCSRGHGISHGREGRQRVHRGVLWMSRDLPSRRRGVSRCMVAYPDRSATSVSRLCGSGSHGFCGPLK